MFKRWYEGVSKTNKSLLAVSVYFSILLMLKFNPIEESRTTATSFDRVMGAGISKNWDITRIIGNFNTWFLLLPLLILLLITFFSFISVKKAETDVNEGIIHLKTLLPVGFTYLFFYGVFYFGNYTLGEEVFNLSFAIISTFILLDVLYYIFDFNKMIVFLNYKTVLFSLISLSFLGAILKSGEWLSGKSWYTVFVILLIVFFACAIFLKNRKIPNNIRDTFFGILPVANIIFLITSLYIELVNILNQYNVFVNFPKQKYIVYIVIIFTSMILAFLIINRYHIKVKLEKYTYPAILVGLGCLSIQIPLIKTILPNIFESANYSILISDFFNYGKIPILEHYGGHMLTDVTEGIIYGILNHDITGAILSPYSVYIYVVIALIFYKVIAGIIDSKEMAFWITLILPFYYFWFYYGIGALVCIAIRRYLREKTYLNSCLIWLCCIIVTFYRLDLGLAFGSGTVFALTFYTLRTKDKESAKKLLIPLGIICSIFFAVVFIICIYKNINMLSRIKEFIYISLSNKDWARDTLGNTGLIAYAWVYIFVPVAMLLTMMFVIFKKECLDKFGAYKYCVLLIMGVTYFVNFPRSLVRHNVVELSLYTTLNFTAYFFISVLVYCITEKKRNFIIMFFMLGFLNSIFLNQTVRLENSLISDAAENSEQFFDSWLEDENGLTVWKSINQKVTRIQWPEEFTQKVDSYRPVFSKLLKENQTFLDFTNQTFLYSALGLECPTYVAQSPGHLSGEYTQIEFINQIENGNVDVPVVLMPSLESYKFAILDGIANRYRYYKVAEYIYKEYVPLCTISTNSLWCKKELYEEYSKMIENNAISYGYDSDVTLAVHQASLEQIPYLWGTYDEKESWNNKEESQVSLIADNFYKFTSSSDLDKEKGNYLLLTCTYSGTDDTNDVEEVPAEILMGTNGDSFTGKYLYTFTLLEGTHQYMIRVSTDYYWYSDKIDGLKLNTAGSLSEVSMKILQGD